MSETTQLDLFKDKKLCRIYFVSGKKKTYRLAERELNEFCMTHAHRITYVEYVEYVAYATYVSELAIE